MANPQTEDGYTAVANEIMEALIAADLSGQEFRIALLIIRKTYGFKKKEDSVSLSQMKEATGMHHVRCSQVVNRLQLMKILTVTENINGIGKKYSFNKDFESWDTVKKNFNRKGFTSRTVKVLRNRPLKKNESTKETLTKENIQKKPPIVPQPDFVRKETWDAYVDHRKKIKKPLTDQAAKLIIKKLDEFRMSGQDPGKILEQSIVNGWTGIFELKSGGANGNGTGRRFDPKDKNWHDREVDEAAARANAIYYGKT